MARPKHINQRMWDCGARELTKLGFDKQWTGYEVIREVAMVFCAEPKRRTKALCPIIREMDGIGPRVEWLLTSAKQAIRKAYNRNPIPWITANPAWGQRLPSSKEFCLFLANLMEEDLEKE